MRELSTDASYGAKLLRLFRILLSDSKKHYLQDLTKQLNCSSQTVLRLIDEIEQEIGTNLNRGKNGRFRWFCLSPQNKVGRLFIDQEDLKFLEICRDIADPYLPKQIKSQIDTKLWNLSLQISEQNNTTNSRFAFFSKGIINYTPFFYMINTILTAINTHQVCVIEYKPSGKNIIKTYKIAPSKIAGMNGALYILGTYVQNDFKTPRHLAYLAVHRLLDVKITEYVVNFPPPEIDYKMFGLPWHPPRTFNILFKKGKASDYVKERIWANHQKIINNTDGSIILQITTTSEPELFAWVRSFGSEAKLLSNENSKCQK